ncbi:MAG: hypothetical protein ACRYGP_28390 [Janthinobacterium lividum]
MTAALYTLIRYLVAGGAAALAGHGWTIANADGATLDAVTQLVIGSIGFVVPAVIGMLTTTVKWTVARLKARHPHALVAAAIEAVAAQPALATAAVQVP